MKLFSRCLLISFVQMSFMAPGNSLAASPGCFDSKQDIQIPLTKYTMTNRGEIRNGNQKFANLPLPKGFIGECLMTAVVKTDTLVVLSLDAVDYDQTDTFVFRVSNKEPQVLWSQHLKYKVAMTSVFILDKILVLQSPSTLTALNPETGNIRWTQKNAEFDSVTFNKLYLLNTYLRAEGTKTSAEGTLGDNGTSPVKFDLNLFDGKIIPPKKTNLPH